MEGYDRTITDCCCTIAREDIIKSAPAHLVYFVSAEQHEVPAKAFLLSDSSRADQTFFRGFFRVLLIALGVDSAFALHLEKLPGKLSLLGSNGL